MTILLFMRTFVTSFFCFPGKDIQHDPHAFVTAGDKWYQVEYLWKNGRTVFSQNANYMYHFMDEQKLI